MDDPVIAAQRSHSSSLPQFEERNHASGTVSEWSVTQAQLLDENSERYLKQVETKLRLTKSDELASSAVCTTIASGQESL
jgi:hypothetical protein